MNHKFCVQFEHKIKTKKIIVSISLIIILITVAMFLQKVSTEFPAVFIYNQTASMPFGWYIVTERNPQSDQLHSGDMIVFNLSADMQNLIYKRGYVSKKNETLLKKIEAVSGDKYAVTATEFFVNGRTYTISQVDSLGRKLPQTEAGSHTVGKDKVIVLTNTQNSFDSRYFGEVPITSIKYKVIPFWTWKG